ncbi:MAG: ABC transporter permease [Eubacteriales bacterium]|nr:ABC transporter permease [Eubacteriales bacterium]
MHKYVIRRVLLLIPIILGVTFIVYFILALTPGDPARFILGSNATDASVEALREQLGLNKPIILRYFTYLAKALRGDFGLSYSDSRPVFDSILVRWPVTVKLALFSTFLSMVIGIPAGIISALKHRSRIDVSFTLVSMIMLGMPSFWLALVLMLVFSLSLRWFPSSGIGGWQHFILPVATMSIGTSASLMRLVRSTMLDTIKQDYIITARAKGAPERVVILRHALKNALMIIITQIGLTFTALLAGAVLIEQVYGLPGLGTLTLIAIRSKDIPMVMGTTIFMAIISTLMILLLDIIYAWIDPRIKAKYVGGSH